MIRVLAMTALALGTLSIAVGTVTATTTGEAAVPAIVETTTAASPAPVSGPVYVITIDGDIELGLAAYVRRSVRDAANAGAGAVVIVVNTPGGRVDAALDIKDILLDSRVTTIALVNRQAFSAGALITLAAEHVYMVPGSSIGAAAPVMGSGEMAGEKMISALREAFASTAEHRGRNPAVAKAMVDQSVTVEGLVDADKLLTLTHDQALAFGIADGSVASLDALLQSLSPRTPQIVRAEPTLAEKLVRFLTNPVVAALLMSLGFLGMFFELQTPGFGLGGSVALLCLGLYFWGHHLAGLAGWESAILIGIGVLLMVIEVFLVPGFGVFGIVGLVAFVTGLFLSRMSQWGLPGEITRAFYVISASLLLMVAGVWAMLTYLPKNRFFAGLVLFSSATDTDTAADKDDVGPPWGKVKPGGYRGLTGVALTDLRPSGTIKIDGAPVDVVTEGAYIATGTTVEVIEDTGSRRVVRAVEDEAESKV